MHYDDNFPCEFRPLASLMLHQPSKKGGHLQYFDMEDGEIEQVQARP